MYVDLDSGSCTEVVHLSHHTTIEGLGTATVIGSKRAKMANNKYKKAICVLEVTCDYPFLITYIDLDSGGCTGKLHLPHHTTIEGFGPAAAAGTSGEKSANNLNCPQLLVIIHF